MADFNWDRPVIIIGAGRSGSTMLSALLGEHPDIYAVGETSFVLNRVWAAYFERPEYVLRWRVRKLIQSRRPEWREMLAYEYLKKADHLPEANALRPAIEEAESRRIALCTGRYMAESLVPPELRKRFWSFKEIWNGSPDFPHGWQVHNQAFPSARYIHIIRHPQSWVLSYFENLGATPNKADVLFALGSWVSMVRTAQKQAVHGDRYLQIRYEDLVGEPEANIRRLLAFLELDDHPRCHQAMGIRYVPTRGELTLPSLSQSDWNSVEGLVELAASLDYDIKADAGGMEFSPQESWTRRVARAFGF